jgi:hypothetical protein
LPGREARYGPATACGVEERVGLVELQLAGEAVPGFTASTHTMARSRRVRGRAQSAVVVIPCVRRDAASSDHLHTENQIDSLSNLINAAKIRHEPAR